MDLNRRVGAFTRGDPEAEYLLDLLSGSAQPLNGTVPSTIIELSQRHGLLGLLEGQSRDLLVRGHRAREIARQSVLEGNLPRLLEALRGSGVRTAVLKGPAVARRYRDPAMRSFSDLDLLVPREDVDRALEVLAVDHAAIRVPDKRPKADKRDVLFEDSGILFNVDLHWDLFSYSQLRGTADGATDLAWSLAREDLDSPYGPSWDLPEDFRLAFLAAHAVLDHRFRLILFRDFVEIAQGDVDWDALGSTAQRWRLRSTTFLALWIARNAGGADVPAEFLSILRPPSFALDFLTRALPRVDLVRFDGHRPHPINLAAVLLNDDPSQSLSLLARAPLAFPHWRRRVLEDDALTGERPPRTMILVSTDRRRGAEVFTERLRAGLAKRGWVVDTVALKGSGEEPRADVETLISNEGATHRRFDWHISRRLRKRIRRFRPDLVVANGGATLRYAFVDRLVGRYVLSYIAIGEPRYWLRSAFSRMINRVMLRSVDQVLAVADATKDQLLDLEPSLDGRVTTTYTGVPSHLFDLTPGPRSGPLRVVMVGSLTPEKNPLLALRAVGQVSDAVIRFVGDGPLKAQLEEVADAMDMSERVEFTGSVVDIDDHLSWAHVLVLTSESEGLPAAILEAGAAAVPAVSVDVGGVAEAISDGTTGFIVEPSAESVAAALANLDSDRDRLAEMGAAARKAMKENFELEVIIDGYERALRESFR